MTSALTTQQQDSARERLIKLFGYLGELQGLKTPPVIHMKGYPWHLPLHRVEPSKVCRLGSFVPATQGADSSGDDFILQVTDPKMYLAKQITAEDKKTFKKTVELWSHIERQSEKLELLLGDAYLLWNSPHGTLKHPLLLQKCSLEFDNQHQTFKVVETDREPLLYEPLLRWAHVDESVISELRSDLSNCGAHPLGREETTSYLKRVLDKIWPDGKLILEDGERLRPSRTPRIIRNPTLFLGHRTIGFSQAIQSMLTSLPTMETIPPALLRIVGFDIPDATDTIASKELAFTMLHNLEQAKVAQRLHHKGCILVQGPPGTGKTHTIANLVGHLLSEGKTILVTSHTAKALRVLREKVTSCVRPLCVSVLDQEQESRHQLEEAVKGIVDRFTKSDQKELKNTAHYYNEQRHQLYAEIEELREEILLTRQRELQPLTVAGKELTTGEVVSQLTNSLINRSWVPDDIDTERPLSLNLEEIEKLYRLSHEIPPQAERDLLYTLPDPEILMLPEQFEELCRAMEELQSHEEDLTDYSHLFDQGTPPLDSLKLLEKDLVYSLPEREGASWHQQALSVGSENRGESIWSDLLNFLTLQSKRIRELRKEVLYKAAESNADLPIPTQIEVCEAIIKHLQEGRNIGTFDLQFKRNWKTFLQGAKVQGHPPSSWEDCSSVLAAIHLKHEIEVLKQRWQNQMEPAEAPEFASLGSQPEEGLGPYIQKLSKALLWDQQCWQPLSQKLDEIGLRWYDLVSSTQLHTSRGKKELIRILQEKIPHIVQHQIDHVRLQEKLGPLEKLHRDIELFIQQHPESSATVQHIIQAVFRRNHSDYRRAYEWLLTLRSLQQVARDRQVLLERLTEISPLWTEQISQRIPPHDQPTPPSRAIEAFHLKQMEIVLSQRNTVSLDKLNQQLIQMQDRYRHLTTIYVENMSWHHQLKRTRVSQQQALIGWLDLMKKIGSGKGKRAPKLKSKAREKLKDCRSAIPVWIMPMSRVAETFSPKEMLFDVVIMDEASQCEVNGLVAFALGKQVLVVGDHEQVSPEPIGVSPTVIENMIEEHLEEIPNRELYDGKTSVYDLARQSFGGTIRLLEHFRCVPEIIAFSNLLCYEGDVKPLRETSGVKLRPPTIEHFVEDASCEHQVNDQEALTIASLIAACCEQPEYEGVSMGAISLLGEKQAQRIDNYLIRHISLNEYHDRRLSCGSPAQFQGDERDIIFLSMVEAPEGSKVPVKNSSSFTKKFNVAASRARDQMWLVHSIPQDHSLEDGDLRQLLLSHCHKPEKNLKMLDKLHDRSAQSYTSPEDEQMFSVIEREFEASGYKVLRKINLGNYSANLVIEGRGGRACVVIEGGNELPQDKLHTSLERESVLQRMGWKFVRIRANQFQLDQESTLIRVLEQLTQLDIMPFDTNEQLLRRDHEVKLIEKIKARAQELRTKWISQDDSEPVEDSAEASGEGPFLRTSSWRAFFNQRRDGEDQDSYEE